MAKEFITAGYLDVKISAKAKRGFTPWKAWKKLWCELKKIDNIDNGLEIKLKSSAESNSVNCFVIPRNATICRTESRTKQFSFGIFGPDRCHKPLLFLSGVSESDSQLWMVSIRRMLSIASHLPVPDGSYYVSLVDNDYSRVAGLTGLHGNLSTNSREVTIKDPFTGDTRTTLPWYQLHQFHLAATGSADDEKRIVVMHTSKEFRSGPGQLHLFCLKAPEVLDSLMTRGKIPRIYVNSFMDTRRFSRSDGDLRESENTSNPADSPSSPVYYRSHSGSDDSGVRVSMASDDSTLVLKCKKAASLISLGFGLLMATPGGSEIDTESSCDLLENEEQCISSQFINIAKRGIDDPRRESGISVMSGVYEEIPDLPTTPSNDDKIIVRQSVHTYEDPVDIILTSVTKFSPPPLPPRRELFRHNSFSTASSISTTSTSFSTGWASPPSTPAEPLSERSNIIDTLVPICESEYMVMTPAKPQTESLYLSMSQATDLENTYMVMSGKGTTND